GRRSPDPDASPVALVMTPDGESPLFAAPDPAGPRPGSRARGRRRRLGGDRHARRLAARLMEALWELDEFESAELDLFTALRDVAQVPLVGRVVASANGRGLTSSRLHSVERESPVSVCKVIAAVVLLSGLLAVAAVGAPHTTEWKVTSTLDGKK